MAKIKKGDLVQVIAGRTSDAKKLEERNARRAELGLDPLKPGDEESRASSCPSTAAATASWSRASIA